MGVLQVTRSPFRVQPTACTQRSTVNLQPQNIFSRLLSAFAGRRARARKQRQALKEETEAQGKYELIEGVRGKIVDLIVIVTDPDELEIDIRFQDNTSVGIQLETWTRLWIENIELMRWKDGNATVVKKLSQEGRSPARAPVPCVHVRAARLCFRAALSFAGRG